MMKKSWKTSLAGLASILAGLGAIGGIISRALDGSMPTMEQLMAAGGLVATGVGLLMAKDSNVTGGTVTNAAPKAPAPSPTAGTMGVMAVLLLAFSLTGCAAFKTEQSTTVTTGPHGGCISSSGYVQVGKSSIECNSACISDQSGVQVTCRQIAAPATATAMIVKGGG